MIRYYLVFDASSLKLVLGAEILLFPSAVVKAIQLFKLVLVIPQSQILEQMVNGTKFVQNIKTETRRVMIFHIILIINKTDKR